MSVSWQAVYRSIYTHVAYKLGTVIALFIIAIILQFDF